jgi:hypothetical protein
MSWINSYCSIKRLGANQTTHILSEGDNHNGEVKTIEVKLHIHQLLTHWMGVEGQLPLRMPIRKQGSVISLQYCQRSCSHHQLLNDSVFSVMAQRWWKMSSVGLPVIAIIFLLNAWLIESHLVSCATYRYKLYSWNVKNMDTQLMPLITGIRTNSWSPISACSLCFTVSLG